MMAKAQAVSLIVAAWAVALAALMGALALTTRTTPVAAGVVLRENLVTGQAQLCGASDCIPLAKPPRFAGRPVD